MTPVNWADYAGASGLGMTEKPGLQAGIHSMADVDSLNKALSAGSDINNPGAAPGEGFPLRVESLDATLFTTTFMAKDIRFWKALAKDQAYNTIEEYNRLEEYGSGDAIYIAEGDLPDEDDSTYSRQYTRIKFMGVTRRVTHVMTTVSTAHGDAVARETTNGTLWLLRQMEPALFTGNEDLISIQFDGLETLMVKAYNSTTSDDGQYLGYEDDNVIDLRGEALTEDHVTDLVERLVAEPNFGSPTSLWLPTGPMKDLSKLMFPRGRHNQNPGADGDFGVAVRSILTPFGRIGLEPDIFIPQSKLPNESGAGNAAVRPGAPTISVAPAAAAYAGANQTFWSDDDAGTYIYRVVAGSRYGRSAPVTSASVAVAADEAVTFTVTDAGPNTSYYIIYRTEAGGVAGTAREIMRVPRTGATQVITDLNRFLPNCQKGYMLDVAADVIKWKQLAPFTKIPLATIDTSVRWMMVLYGALQLQKPKQAGMFINIGPLRTGAFA